MRFAVLFMSMLLSFGALPAQQLPKKPLPDLFQLDKDANGQVLVSITTAQRSLSVVLKRLASGIQCKLVIDAKLEQDLNDMRPLVVLKKRPPAEILEFLAGFAGCQFRLSDKEIFFFREPTPVERAQDIVIGYRKIIYNAAADSDSKQGEQHAAIANFSLGTLFFLDDKHDLAQNEYQQLLQHSPPQQLFAHTLLMLARSFLAIGQPQRARVVLGRFFNQFPKNEFVDTAFLLLADCYEKEFNRMQAAQVYQYLLRKPGSACQATAAGKLGQLYLQENRIDDARPMLELAVSLLPSHSPEKAEAMHNYLLCLIGSGRQRETTAVFARFYQEFPQHPTSEKVLLLHAACLLNQGDTMSAYYVARMGRKSSSPALRAQYALLACQAMMQAGDVDLAHATLDETGEAMAEVEKNDPRILFEIGLAYQKQRRWQKAKEIFRRLEGRLEDTVYLRILECDQALGNYRDCLQNFNSWQSRLTTPQVVSEACYLAGECWCALGEPNKAISLWMGKGGR